MNWTLVFVIFGTLIYLWLLWEMIYYMSGLILATLEKLGPNMKVIYVATLLLLLILSFMGSSAVFGICLQ